MSQRGPRARRSSLALRLLPVLLMILIPEAAVAVLAAQDAPPAARLHEVCGACHTEPASDFQEHPHFARGLQCDACHGPSKPHREATGHKPPDQVAGPAEQPAVCGACHTAQRKQYEASKHGQLVAARAEKKAAACTTCHGTHSLRAPAAILTQCVRCHPALPDACRKEPPPSSTPVAGAAPARVSCMRCHDKHALSARR